MLFLIVLPLAVIILILIFKIIVMRRSMREIADQLSEKLSGDTNTLISVSSQDRYIRKLAATLNKELSLLRRERLKYERGDEKLKSSVINVSHDLRTPLCAICGYLDLLESDEKSAESAKYLSVIRERTNEMRTLCDEFFSYSLAAASLDERSGRADTVNLGDILEQSLAGFYAEFTKRGIVPEISMPDSKVERLLDRAALRRIFDNILSNALKYSDGGLSVSLDDDGEVSFENPAEGLGAVDVNRLFDRFFTVETGRRSTGLGLSIAKNLTESMGGSIGAEYQNGRLRICLRFEA